MREQDKITERDLSEMEINNLPDGEFKVMFIKILNGLERRVENISDTLTTEMKKNQPDIKNIIIEFKNTLDGTNSRLEESEE